MALAPVRCRAWGGTYRRDEEHDRVERGSDQACDEARGIDEDCASRSNVLSDEGRNNKVPVQCRGWLKPQYLLVSLRSADKDSENDLNWTRARIYLCLWVAPAPQCIALRSHQAVDVVKVDGLDGGTVVGSERGSWSRSSSCVSQRAGRRARAAEVDGGVKWKRGGALT
jgi:hypothetical protein